MSLLGKELKEGVLEQAQQLQQEEYEVLESIYPECISGNVVRTSLKLEVPIEFDQPRRVQVIEDGTLSRNQAPETQIDTVELLVETLPTILLNITLPETYPVDCPPELVSIRSTHSWVSETSRLHSLLTSKWQPGDGVLYDWMEYIRTGSFLDELNLISPTDPDLIQIPHPAPQMLSPLLIAFDQSTRSRHFAENSYLCGVCLSSHKGSNCVQLTCQHVFCRPCLEDFWKLCIAEGEVGRVGCPDPECVKSKREATEEEVARIVTEQELQRWKWLREKRIYDKDPSVVNCPMEFCQSPVPRPGSVEADSGWDRLRSCSRCMFSFCVFCRRTWHGPITPCLIPHSAKVVEEYLGHPEGSEGRTMLERRFGKKNIQRLVAVFLEEQANKEWLKASTMACPGCQVHVEKTLGCNHMTCAKCAQHFCYRCGARIDGRDPYEHFSTKGKSCYNKLFDGATGNEDDWVAMDGFA
ncbi:RWD-domain-containing protein [Pluteus cervinus]|uniref:RWD-domain-containing protein n=1 Tax=Pluteus cervinus TaxID=181527 RepID=A0ACD3BH41_9AGAR|nr:RWD-domain-containing protein [Pluteus cervinus]